MRNFRCVGGLNCEREKILCMELGMRLGKMPYCRTGYRDLENDEHGPPMPAYGSYAAEF